MLICKKHIISLTKDFLKGTIIGSSMLIPGLSGGTAAIILDIYDSLTEAAGGIFRTPKKSVLYLLPFAAGGLCGAYLFSGLVIALIDSQYELSMFFFIGAILGAVPLLVKKSGIGPREMYYAVFALFGAAAAVGIRFIPAAKPGEGSFLINVICGFIIAVGMVLPGISTSHLLLILGMYEAVWGCLHNPDIMFLLPLLAGAGAGTVLTAGLTDKAIKKYPAASYMVITGFVMSSVYDIFPENTDSSRLPINILLCIAGFITVYIITRFADRNKQCS